MENISVLNYNSFAVVISTKTEGFLVPAMTNGVPSSIPLSYQEIEYINTSSNAFKTGTLRFEVDIEEEMYKSLRIVNWKDILTNKQIEDMLINPTMEGLQRIVDIQDVNYFERIRGIFVGLKNSNEYDISTREKVINTDTKNCRTDKRIHLLFLHRKIHLIKPQRKT